MKTSTCRWGILSAAEIAKKNWQAIARSGNGQLVAVAARRGQAAKEFVEFCQRSCPVEILPETMEGYDLLLERTDIDAVYIPLPTAIRGEWIRKALEAGKHVLAEKPAASNSGELAPLLQLAAERKLQYMDGVMFMHSKRLPLLREVLDAPKKIGKLKRIAAHFSFFGGDEFNRENIRSMSQFEPHGCLGDLGWYCIRLILWAKKFKLPKAVIGRTLSTIQGNDSPESVPSELSAELLWDDGFSASFYCSFETDNQQWAHFSGENGYITLRDFVLPFYGCESSFELGQARFLTHGCNFHMQEHNQRFAVHEYSDSLPGAQEVELFRTFSQLVIDNKVDPRWPSETLATQRVIDAVMKSSQQNSALIQL